MLKKYYVTDWQMDFSNIAFSKNNIESARFLTLASSPVMACALAIHFKFSTAMINGSYRVSEKGFEIHNCDIFIDSNKVNEVYLDLCENNYFNKKGDT